MKTIILKSLTLVNFRDVTGSFDLQLGRNVFSGPNGSGKTTLFDAVEFNRTGKDSQGKTDFAVKTIVGGSPVAKGEHNVTAVYDVDGKTLELSRTFFEKWSKKRGDAEATKDGNQTRYAVDGIETTKTKYNAAIDQAFGPDYALCSDLSAVTGMAWK